MKNILKFEFLKIFTSKLFLYTLFAFIVADVIILVYTTNTSQENDISYSSYQLLNQQIKDLTQEEKKELIEKEYEKIYAFSIINNIKNMRKSENEEIREYSKVLEKENNKIYENYIQQYENATFPYTKDLTKELKFWEEIKQEFEETQNYRKTINDILQKAENLENISIFTENENDFSSKNIKDIAKEYEKMLDTKIDYQLSKGINSFTKMGITDIFIILLIFVISSIIVFEEREKNLFTLIKSTKHGRTKTIISKIIVLCVSIAGISAIIYFINFIYYGITIGYGNLGASLQSINMFLYSILKINIGQYLLLFICTKIIVFFIISLIILFISTFAKNNISTYITFIAIFLISFMLYNTIDPASKYNIFKYINILSFLETNEIYKTYFNLKIGYIMQNVLTLSIIFGIILLVSTILGIIYIFNKKKDLQIRESYILNNLKRITICKFKITTNILSNEIYKLFITNKIAIILVLFMIFQIYSFCYTNQSISFEENIYKNYMEILSGEITQEKVKFIEEEKEKFRQAQISIQNIEEKVKDGKLSKNIANRYKEPYEDILSTQQIFNKVLEKYEYIQKNPEAEFVYDTGYKELLRINKNSFLENDFYLMMISIMCFTSIFVMEYKTGMINILNTTPKGRRWTAKAKIISCIFAGTFIFIISIMPEILKIQQTFGFNNLTASIRSLSYFSNLPATISILGYMIIMYLLRFISFISIILFILWITLKIKNSTYSILVTTIVFLIPIILTKLGLEMIDSITVVPILNVSKIILAGGNLYWLYIIIPIIIGIYCSCKMCEKFK